MFARDKDSLRDLVRNQHDEFMQYQRRHDEEFRGLVQETREFNREILLRNEKVYTSMIVQLEENTEQTRANTKAVLSMLDRFNGSGGVAA